MKAFTFAAFVAKTNAVDLKSQKEVSFSVPDLYSNSG